MVTIQNAQIYKIGSAIAYSLEYSEGTRIRVIEGDGIIRKEYLKNGEWIQLGKPYVIKHNRKRNAECIKRDVINFIRN